MHHADPTRLIHTRRVDMILELRSVASRLSRTAFKHDNDKWHRALKHCAVLKGLLELVVLVSRFPARL